MSNLYTLFESRFPHDRTTCCIETHDGKFISWDQLERTTARIASFLTSLQLPRNSRIAVQVEKSAEALMLYLATIRAGFVYLPLNTAYRELEVAYFIEDAKPAVVVCSPGNLSETAQLALRSGILHVFSLGQTGNGTLLDSADGHADKYHTVDRMPDDLAVILYTSGTTGRSKGAMLTHGNLIANALVLHAYWEWQRDDVLLHALPLFHIHGLLVASHGALLSGSKMIFLPKFDSKSVLSHLPRSSIFMGVPTYYVRLLCEPEFEQNVCSSMRLFLSGSAPMLTETFDEFTRRTGHTILERYGMSETGMLTSNPYSGKRVGGTVGFPLPAVSLRIIGSDGQECAPGEIGDIQVKGPNVFKGYWEMPEKTAMEFTDDGYFKTGDVGKFNDEGYVSIVGRSKDLIITGGYNVYPKEIESFLDDLNGVAESAVIGVPHPDFGEAVTAVIVPKPDAALSSSEVIAQIKNKIANFKVPKNVHFIDALPRNTMGKVQKNLLRERYKTAFTEPV